MLYIPLLATVFTLINVHGSGVNPVQVSIIRISLGNQLKANQSIKNINFLDLIAGNSNKKRGSDFATLTLTYQLILLSKTCLHSSMSGY